jgi:hypothetical protein
VTGEKLAALAARRGREAAPSKSGSYGARSGAGHLGRRTEAPALVARLNEIAVVGETIEQRGRHLWIAEHAHRSLSLQPFAVREQPSP